MIHQIVVYALRFSDARTVNFENLYSTEIHPVANNMREHREKVN